MRESPLIFRAAVLTWLLMAMPAVAATITIASEPPGANVYVDDTFLGVTPLSLEDLAAGPHVVHLEKRGYLRWRGRLDAGEEDQSLSAALVAVNSCDITVASRPEACHVYVDGELRGKTPLTVTDLSPELHSVQIVREGYESFETEVDLEEQTHATVEAELEALIEDYLLSEIEAHPEVVTNHADLAHHFVLAHRFDEAYVTFARGLDAVADYEDAVNPNDVYRLVTELERVYTAQYDYAPADVVAAQQPRVIETYEAAVERHPDCGDLYIGLGDLYTAAGDTAKAMEVFERGVEQVERLHPSIRLRARLGTRLAAIAAAQAKQENHQAALDTYQSIIDKMPQSYNAVSARSSMATIYAGKLNDYDKAIAVLEELVAVDPDRESAATYLNQVAAYQQAKEDTAGAMATYGRLAQEYPESSNAVTALSRLGSHQWNEEKDLEKALATYRRLVELAPGSITAGQARKQIGDLLVALGRTEEAAAFKAQVLEEYPESYAAYYFVEEEERKARYRAAATLYQEAAAMAKEGRNEEAVAKYQEAFDQYPDTYHGKRSLDQAITLLHSTLKDLPRAIAARRAFIDRYPDDLGESPSHLWYIGYTYAASLGDTENGVAAYREFIERYPEDPEAPKVMYYLGSLYLTTLGDLEQAVATFTGLADRYPESTYYDYALHYLGESYIRQAEVDKAREVWMRLMVEKPGSSYAYQSAESYVRTRRREGKGQWADEEAQPAGAAAEGGNAQ